MALGKKGSRAIHVDGVDYRWAASPDSGCMWIVVQPGSGRGQRLEVCISYGDEDGGSAGQPIQAAQVSPGVVREAITHALAAGWHPVETGVPPFRLDAGDEGFEVR